MSPWPTRCAAWCRAATLEGLRRSDLSDQRPALLQLYDATSWQPLWTRSGRATPQARAVVAHLAAAADAGLRPDDYDADKLAERLGAFSSKTPPAQRARLDVALSVSLMRNLSDLRLGRRNPARGVFELGVGDERYGLAELVREIAGSDDVPALLALVEPPYARYAGLEKALKRYRKLAANPGLTPPPDLGKLRPGARHPGVPALRRWLEALGDAAPADPVSARSDVYDRDLVAAVKRFQARHGLTSDGVIGAGTAQALRVPLNQRVRQIELSLERWRWLPSEADTTPVVVNVPEFRLYSLERAEGPTRVDMRVIVGEAIETETPMLSGEMESIVFRPYWNVPYSIVRKEMLPKIRRDPGYLGRERLEIVGGGRATRAVTPGTLAGLASGSLGLRQRPGADNSLGLVKFIFPNDEDIYLHATPARHLFSRQRRDFSHGCIRLEDPVAFAAYLLRNQPEWTRARIESAMHAGSTQQVYLAQWTPIHVVYMTATVTPDGDVAFFEDIYGLDAELGAQVGAMDSYRPWAATRTGSASGSQLR